MATLLQRHKKVTIPPIIATNEPNNLNKHIISPTPKYTWIGRLFATFYLFVIVGLFAQFLNLVAQFFAALEAKSMPCVLVCLCACVLLCLCAFVFVCLCACVWVIQWAIISLFYSHPFPPPPSQSIGNTRKRRRNHAKNGKLSRVLLTGVCTVARQETIDIRGPTAAAKTT